MNGKVILENHVFFEVSKISFFIHDYENKIIEIMNKNLHIEGGKKIC